MSTALTPACCLAWDSMMVRSWSDFTTPRRVTFVPMVMIWMFRAANPSEKSNITARRIPAVIFSSATLLPWLNTVGTATCAGTEVSSGGSDAPHVFQTVEQWTDKAAADEKPALRVESQLEQPCTLPR